MSSFFLKPLVIVALLAQAVLLSCAWSRADVRVIIQGPPPTQPEISVSLLAAPNTIEMILLSDSDGPAPPYEYEIDQAPTAEGPWTTIVPASLFPILFTGTPPTSSFGVGGSIPRTTYFRARALDSASPERQTASEVVSVDLLDDLLCDDINFDEIVNWPASTQATEDCSITGITAPVPISISGGNAQYSKNFGGFTSSPGTVSNNDFIQLRVTSSAVPGTTTLVTLTIGARSFVWSVITAASGTWPAQAADARIHALPGVNTYGSDSFGGSGRHPGSTGVDVLMVNSFSTSDIVTPAGSPYPSGYFFASYHGAMHHLPSSGRAKKVYICRSGAPVYNGNLTTAAMDNWSLLGQFAPGLGFWPLGQRLITRGNHVQIWHIPFYLGGNSFFTLPADQAEGDPVRVRGKNQTVDIPDHVFFVCCEFSGGTDENMDSFRGVSNIGCIYCAWFEPFGYFQPSRNEWIAMYGPLFGGGVGNFVNNAAIERSFFASASHRNPFMSAQNTLLANNIWYNIGEPPDADKESLTPTSIYLNNQSGYTSPQFANMLRNMHVRGPNSGAIIAGALIQTHVAGEFPVGSRYRVEGNVQHGWTDPPSQTGYIWENNSVNMQAASGVLSQAMPSGRTTGLVDTYRIAANAASPTQAERLAFFSLIRDSVGVRPNHRTLSAGRLQRALNQCLARLNGDLTPGNQFVRNLAQQGGWWTVPQITVNPLDPGSHWHAPIPIGPDRNTPLTSGAFSNGRSAVGYTPMEVFDIEQHYFVGGR